MLSFGPLSRASLPASGLLANSKAATKRPRTLLRISSRPMRDDLATSVVRVSSQAGPSSVPPCELCALALTHRVLTLLTRDSLACRSWKFRSEARIARRTSSFCGVRSQWRAHPSAFQFDPCSPDVFGNYALAPSFSLSASTPKLRKHCIHSAPVRGERLRQVGEPHAYSFGTKPRRVR